VSPQVWAWRQSRVAGIRDSIDKILCVLPFEAEFFAEHGIAADFVGHPLADAIPFSVDRNKARESIGCNADGPVIAILPGSRGSEVSRLAPPFFETAMWLSERRPDLRFVVALANEKAENIVKQTLQRQAIVPQPLLIRGRAREVIAAADVVLTASGTATLETLLLNRRMVVAHRMSPLTYWIVRRLGVSNLPNFSLPNLLAGRQIVPEFVQRQVRADLLGPAILDVLEGRRIDPQWREIFTEIHQNLHRDANRAAAKSVLALVPGAT
jgi:lipid-A-disaccharide synthase